MHQSREGKKHRRQERLNAKTLFFHIECCYSHPQHYQMCNQFYCVLNLCTIRYNEYKKSSIR